MKAPARSGNRRREILHLLPLHPAVVTVTNSVESRLKSDAPPIPGNFTDMGVHRFRAPHNSERFGTLPFPKSVSIPYMARIELSGIGVEEQVEGYRCPPHDVDAVPPACAVVDRQPPGAVARHRQVSTAP